MKIYNIEKELGLSAKILANLTIAYTSQVDKVSNPDIINKVNSAIKTISGKSDDDLYYTKSILVTSNWNRNDDVFDSAEVWKARHTPEHKPTNLEHDEHVLVGHMTENWVIDEKGEIIADDTAINDLPNIFHIVNGAVIYTNWDDEALIERTQKLIAEIEEGKKFVSMECLFSNFDYAVITAEGKHHIIERQEDSAWLTKHLRSYGGTGEYEGNRIGRLLRDINFCGKGYVDNPANPESIIFNDKNIFNFHSVSLENPFIIDNGVIYITEGSNSLANTKDQKENDIMSDILQAQNTELKAKIAEVEARAKKAEEDLIKADVEKLQSENDELAKQNASQAEDSDTLKKQIAELTDKNDKLEKDFTDQSKAKDDLEAKLLEVKAAELRTSRIADLINGGIEKESAVAKVDKFTNLNDEQFEEIAEELIKAVKAQVVTTEGTDENQDDSGEDTDASDETDEADDVDNDSLENAEANKDDIDLSTGGEESKEDNLRKELREAIAQRLGHNKIEDDDEDDE